MRATRKMKAFGLEALSVKTGNEVSVLYRWVHAMQDGRGIKDRNKLKLIEATRGSEYAIRWEDFDPQQAAEAAA